MFLLGQAIDANCRVDGDFQKTPIANEKANCADSMRIIYKVRGQIWRYVFPRPGHRRKLPSRWGFPEDANSKREGQLCRFNEKESGMFGMPPSRALQLASADSDVIGESKKVPKKCKQHVIRELRLNKRVQKMRKKLQDQEKVFGRVLIEDWVLEGKLGRGLLIFLWWNKAISSF
ncbi:hypothetical protein Tcan_07050 [Toxocara canis]|uniref:Uncharacterized protein n=1 Tax=Toxocara canis TaxID=6265 RepID=A0A0B2W6X2_TOXCA|nr:hypothetical protein Tcan_07050 [Toxocara canis]